VVAVNQPADASISDKPTIALTRELVHHVGELAGPFEPQADAHCEALIERRTQ
jgi:hypothetical protein